MIVSLPADVLRQYERFSLYNSPYVAHDRGCAIDLYPGTDTEIKIAPSPVAGEVLDTKRVKAPPKPYAAPHDYLILIDCGEYVARTLHVEPRVSPGERVDIGDPLGRLIRAGFFAPWVDNHVHLGFRTPDANPYRAAGSLPIVPDVRPLALSWDGSGTVTETGDTYAILDTPAHPDPGTFAGIAASFVPDSASDVSAEERDTTDEGTDTGTDRGADASERCPEPSVRSWVLDGGLPHYDGGGALPARPRRTTHTSDAGVPGSPIPASVPNTPDTSTPGDGGIEFLRTEIGIVTGRDVTWCSISVRANGRPITGLSLFCARDPGFGAKLVCPDAAFELGERVTVSIRPAR